MDKRLQEIAENFDKMKIGLDDMFKFHCTECGKCCTQREDIMLTPRDVYNMAKELQMTPIDMIREYCEVYIGHDSRFPIVRILPRRSIRRCPFLKDRKCSIHKAKPTVCAMFPIGRAIKSESGQLDIEKLKEKGIQYILQPITCGDDSETFTVRQYLEMFGLPVDDPFFFEWQSLLCSVSVFAREAEKKVSEKTMQLVWNTVFVCAYVSYDMDQQFIPQFMKNKEGLMHAIGKIRQTLPANNKEDN